MKCEVTNPTTRAVPTGNGGVTYKTEAVDVKLNNGRVHVQLMPGATAEYDLTGDQLGYLEAIGLKVKCPERDAPVPVGSKAWRAALTADGKDPEAELAAIAEAKKPKKKEEKKPAGA